MTTILITGGAGFIGTNLSKTLLRKGYRVVAVDNLITSTGQNLNQFKGNKNFTFIKSDITKKFSAKLLSKIKDVKTIYHLACPTGVPNTVRYGEEMLITCSVGTRNVLNLAKEKKARLIFTSSSEVYGNPKIFPQTESYTGNVNPIGTRGPYEEGKRFSEALVLSYVRKYNLNASILRLFNTYGPYANRKDLRVIPRFLDSINNNRNIIVFDKGKQKRTFLFVDDLVSGLILISKKGKRGEVYNIGSTEEISIYNLAKLCLKQTEAKNKIQFMKSPIEDHDRRLPDVSKIDLKSEIRPQRITLILIGKPIFIAVLDYSLLRYTQPNLTYLKNHSIVF